MTNVDSRRGKIIKCEKCGEQEPLEFILVLNKWLCEACQKIAIIK